MSFATHKVAGVYADRAQANEGARALREAGFEPEDIFVVDRDDWQTAFADPQEAGQRAENAALSGAVAGAGVGAAGAGALAIAEVSVIAAAPVFATLAGAGLGAVVGTAIAGVSSASVREPDFREMVREAIHEDHSVVVARPHSEADALKAQDVIAKTADSSIDQYGGVAS